MHHRHHHERGHGRIHFRGPFPNRQDLLERLENYRRDLEQELADVSDVIEHLRDKEAATRAAGAGVAESRATWSRRDQVAVSRSTPSRLRVPSSSRR